MDKLKREIVYKKQDTPESKKETVESNPSEVDLLQINNLIVTKSRKIIEWIKSHPAIKWSVICDEAGINKSNFCKALKADNPKLKAENIIKLEKQLKKYGYESYDTKTNG